MERTLEKPMPLFADTRTAHSRADVEKLDRIGAILALVIILGPLAMAAIG